MRKLVIAIVATLVTAVGCTSIDCPVQNVVYTSYTLHKADGSADSLKDTMYVLTYQAKGKDTIIFNAGIGLSKFSLPVGYANPEDTLYFIMRNVDYLAVDTVWIKKENYPHFESVDCSASYFHKLTAIRTTHHAIDSFVINKSFVDYDASTEHVHLYFKARN